MVNEFKICRTTTSKQEDWEKGNNKFQCNILIREAGYTVKFCFWKKTSPHLNKWSKIIDNAVKYNGGSLFIRSSALAWLCSYLSNQFRGVIVNNTSSDDATLKFGVSAGIRARTPIVSSHVNPRIDIAASHALFYFCYANDTQLYVSSHQMQVLTSNPKYRDLYNKS